MPYDYSPIIRINIINLKGSVKTIFSIADTNSDIVFNAMSTETLL